MEYLRWLFGLSLHNSSTKDNVQTHATAEGIANQAGQAFFRGVRDMTVENATFVQHIHDPSASRPGGLVAAVNQNSGTEANTTVVQPGELGQHETTIRAPFEIYYEELLKQKRGLPLWFPGPSLDLPLTYRRNGITVGDVGIMQIDEPFDFLFNIFLPANDPINSEGVPDSFKPLGKCDISEIPCDTRDGSVGSSSVRRSVHSEPSGLTFETSAAEGAILVLPQGSSRRAIKSLQSIWDYMTPSTVQSWYQYAKKRGRQIQNGNIVIVFKCDKASSWGIATFSSTEGQMTSLTFKEVNGNQLVTPTYDWVCNGTANTQMRVGPSADENSDFSGMVKNQCVFLQALNPRLSDRSWRELEQHLGAKVDESSHEILQYPAFGGGPSNQPLHVSAPFIQGNFQRRLINHPSLALNICLLKNYPNARMAITTDEDWMPLMTQEGALPPSQQLFDQIQQSYIICNKDGVVFLDQLKSEPSCSLLTHPYDIMNVDSPIASESFHIPGAYPSVKEHNASQPFSDIYDHLPGVPSNAYHSEYPDGYAMGGINNHNPNVPFFRHFLIQQFLDKLGHYLPDHYYTHQALHWQKILVYVGFFIGILTAIIIQVPKPQQFITCDAVQNFLDTSSIFYLYISLAVSITVVAFTLIVSVWLIRYQRSITGMGPTIHERIRQWDENFMSLMEWRLPIIIEILPILALVSLFLFANFIRISVWKDYPAIGITLDSIFITAALFFLLTASCAAFIPGALFHLPLSNFIRLTFQIFPNWSIHGLIHICTVCVMLLLVVIVVPDGANLRLPCPIDILLEFLLYVFLLSLDQETQGKKKVQEHSKPPLFSLATWVYSSSVVIMVLSVMMEFMPSFILFCIFSFLRAILMFIMTVGAIKIMSQWTFNEGKAKAN